MLFDKYLEIIFRRLEGFLDLLNFAVLSFAEGLNFIDQSLDFLGLLLHSLREFLIGFPKLEYNVWLHLEFLTLLVLLFSDFIDFDLDELKHRVFFPDLLLQLILLFLLILEVDP